MAPEEQGPVPMMGYIVQFQILTADKVAAASGMIQSFSDFSGNKGFLQTTKKLE